MRRGEGAGTKTRPSSQSTLYERGLDRAAKSTPPLQKERDQRRFVLPQSRKPQTTQHKAAVIAQIVAPNTYLGRLKKQPGGVESRGGVRGWDV
jgi:hypothetical protein